MQFQAYQHTEPQVKALLSAPSSETEPSQEASLTDYAMLFVRCHDGISHHEDENVRADDVALALDAFEVTILTLANDFDG